MMTVGGLNVQGVGMSLRTNIYQLHFVAIAEQKWTIIMIWFNLVKLVIIITSIPVGAVGIMIQHIIQIVLHIKLRRTENG